MAAAAEDQVVDLISEQGDEVEGDEVEKLAVEDGEDPDSDDDEDEEDDGFDFGEIVEKAAEAVKVSRARIDNLPPLGLDTGLDESFVYFSAGKNIDTCKAFDIDVKHGVTRLNINDFGTGYDLTVQAQGTKRREVRGVAPRPANDTKLRKIEAKTAREEKLDKWFGMRKKEHTPEVIKELKVLQLRGAADPKRFYKANDSKELPKYFTFATEVGGGMAPAGEKGDPREVTARSGRSLLDSIMRDQTVQEYTWKRTQEVGNRGQAARWSGHGQATRLSGQAQRLSGHGNAAGKKGASNTKRGGTGWKTLKNK